MKTSEESDARLNSIRAYAGGVALAVGIVGFVVGFIILILTEPFGGFAVGNWNGDPPRPSEAQKAAAVKRIYLRMIPFFIGTSILVMLGINEGLREQRLKQSRDQE